MVVLACAAPIALATRQEVVGDRSIVEAAQELGAGAFLWEPELVPDGPMLFIVSVVTQRGVLYRNGVPIAVTTVSTGRDGYPTPLGVFTILQKQARHFSSIYDNAPMPYMQRLTWGGVALHGGQLPGYPASHGCIRLPQGFAKRLFEVTRLGMTVVVTDAVAAPRLAPTRDPLPVAGIAGGRPSWQPERQPGGPMTIVVSAADRRLVVLRNGREIGSAPVAIEGRVAGTRAYVMRAGAEGAIWARIALSGEAPEEVGAGNGWRNMKMDLGFRAELLRALVPGTTVLLTSESLRAGAPPAPLLEFDPDHR
jgi:hypothetical protein